MKVLTRLTANLLALVLALPAPLPAVVARYRTAAVDAGRWLRASAVRTDAGVVWPADPRDPKTVDRSLFSGTAGVVLFFLEAARVTGDRSYLADARAGADALLEALRRNAEKEAGLYTGVAGMGFALAEVHKATRVEKYRLGAVATVQRLRERAVAKGAGVEWNDYTDVVLGNAGIGLFLLYAARTLRQPDARDLALRAGQRLLELGQPASGGLKWAMRQRSHEQLPNFAHGTAGVAYFLATLFRETKHREFLDGALAGARYLQALAGDACLIPHREGKNDFYHLSWAHGPAGTARLFYRLYEVTGDPRWMEWVRKCARAILTSGAPEKHSPGFWNNEGLAYGTAGLVEFLLALHIRTGDREYLNYARRAAAHLLTKATRDEASGGLKWVHATSSAWPNLVSAQTGLMHGAAGIALVLLRLDALERGIHGGIAFPDSPF